MSRLGLPVIVLGMYRGGTSSVAGALAAGGVFFGDEADLYEANEYNPGGYFESLRLARLFTDIVNALKRQSNDSEPIPENWQEIPYLAPFAHSLKEQLLDTFRGHSTWGWKDPRTSLVLPIVNSVLDELAAEPVYVIPCRHPAAVARSKYISRVSDSFFRMGHWVRYMLEGLRWTRGKRRTIIMYEDLVQNPGECLSRALSVVPELSVTDSMVSTIRKDWVHQTVNPADDTQTPDIALRVYDLYSRAARNLDGLNEGAFDEEVHQLSTECSSLFAMFRDLPPQTCLARVSRVTPKGLETETTEFTPRIGWQTLAIPVPRTGAETALISLYDYPARVWIRKAEWYSGDEVVGPLQFKQGMAESITKEHGYDVLWTLPGEDQLVASLPSSRTPLTARFEVCVELNPSITGQAFSSLSTAYYRAVAQLRNR